ncbi:MAG: hypothetical protein Q9180_000932 [Flavoplaca navasiana]
MELCLTASTQHTNAVMDLVVKIFRYHDIKQNETQPITEHARFLQHSKTFPVSDTVHMDINQAWQDIKKAIDTISKLLFTPSDSVRARKQALEENVSQEEFQKPTMQHVAKDVIDKPMAHQNTMEERLKEVEWNVVTLLKSEMKRQATVSIGATDSQNAPSLDQLAADVKRLGDTVGGQAKEWGAFKNAIKMGRRELVNMNPGQVEIHLVSPGSQIKLDAPGSKFDLLEKVTEKVKAIECTLASHESRFNDATTTTTTSTTPLVNSVIHNLHQMYPIRTLQDMQNNQTYFQRQLEIFQQLRNTLIQSQHDMGREIKQDILGVGQDLIDHIARQDKAEEDRKQQYADLEQERDDLRDGVRRVKEQYSLLALQADTEREANEKKSAEIELLDQGLRSLTTRMNRFENDDFRNLQTEKFPWIESTVKKLQVQVGGVAENVEGLMKKVGQLGDVIREHRDDYAQAQTAFQKEIQAIDGNCRDQTETTNALQASIDAQSQNKARENLKVEESSEAMKPMPRGSKRNPPRSGSSQISHKKRKNNPTQVGNDDSYQETCHKFSKMTELRVLRSSTRQASEQSHSHRTISRARGI